MNRQICLLSFVIIIIGNSFAQNTKSDSLENLIQTHKAEDSIKVKLINEFVRNTYRIDADKAHNYANKAIELASNLNFRKGQLESFYLIASSLSYHKSDKLALQYYLKALKIAEDIDSPKGISSCLVACGIKYAAIGNISEAKDCYNRALEIGEKLKNPNILTSCLINLSVIYTGEGDYQKALDGYERSLQILEKHENKKMRSTVFNNIGEINKYQGNYPQALEYYHKALKICEENNDQFGISTMFLCIGTIGTLQGNFNDAYEYVNKALKIAMELNNKRQISRCYEEIGNIYLQTNKQEALSYLEKGLKIAEEFSYQTAILNISSKIGDLHRNQGNFHRALDSYSKALKISEQLRRKRTICETSIKISDIHILTNENNKALAYSLRSLTIADELKLLSNQRDVHRQLSGIYEAINEYKNAYLHHKKFKKLNDSIFNERNIKKQTELEFTYKFEKEKQLIELEQEKKDSVQRAILVSLIAGLLLMLLFALYVFRSSRIKHRTNLVLSKQKHEIEKLNEEYMVVNEELMITNNELTEAKKMVEKSEERLNLLIKNSNDILVLVDEHEKQFFISDAAKNLTGYTIDELLGSVEEVIFPDDRDIVRQHWNRVIANKDVADTIQYRHKHKEHGYVWFEAVAQNFLHHPAIKSIVANIRDISERKLTEKALQESEAAKAQLLTNEITRINEELELNQKSMTAATLKLIQNSERDAQTIERLLEIEKNVTPEGKQKIKSLIADNKRISYNSNWDEFEILFEKVHRSFYEKMNTQFPNLTPNERKMCAFLKLNMSNKDIAQITFQSDDALKKARLRLRQKLEIGRETNLATFIQNI